MNQNDPPAPYYPTIADFRVGESYSTYLRYTGRDNKIAKNGEPYYDCHFADRTGKVGAKAWNNGPLFQACRLWSPGDAIFVTGVYSRREPYPASLEIQHVERVADDPEKHSEFQWSMLIEASHWSPETLWQNHFKNLNASVEDKRYVNLIQILVQENAEVLSILPAAQGMHHAMRTGWLEHIWSMTRLSIRIGKHYSDYYADLQPPLQTDIIITGAVLHDIGKRLELAYDGTGETTYTDKGRLVGHIVMGRDMIREAASKLDPPLDEERLLRLEHAVLAHHGIKEYGSPVEPQTLEALILSQIDDMDAKINAVVKALRTAQIKAQLSDGSGKPEGVWTEKIGAVKPPRSFYRGNMPPPTATEENQTSQPDTE